MERGDWKEVWKRVGGIEGLQEVQTKWSPERGGEIISTKLLNTSQELKSHSTAMEKELGSGRGQKGQPQRNVICGRDTAMQKGMVPLRDVSMKEKKEVTGSNVSCRITERKEQRPLFSVQMSQCYPDVSPP